VDKKVFFASFALFVANNKTKLFCLKPQASSLKPQASSLKPQASSLKPVPLHQPVVG
jgi:hypothetical protein